MSEILTQSGAVLQSDFLDSFFQKGELIPAIVQESGSKEVLMLGYTWFYSRSRQELWNKGATSGHLQKIIRIYGDCDDDTLLVEVEQIGAACHTGSHTCFFNEIWKR